MLKRADVVFTRGNKLLHRLIRWGQTSPGESPTYVNHALLVLSDSPDLPGHAMIIESESRVRAGLLGQLHRGDWFFAYRPLNLNPGEAALIRDAALRRLHEKYGWSQLILQLIDAKVFRGADVARRLASRDSRPICSRLVAEAYAVADYTFGLPPAACDPDSMLDFCTTNPDKYLFVTSGTL